MEPKVSVILPVYNTEAFLPECLDSLLSQTLREIEVICVDDGSTDGSLALLNAYAEKDPRVQVLTQQNQYAGVARNHGLRYAKGKYVAFLDSDDFFAPEMLETVAAVAETEDADICAFLTVTYNNKTGETEGKPRGFRKEYLPENHPFNANDMPDRAFVAMNDVVSTKMIRRAFIEEEGIQFLPYICTNDHYFSYVSVACAKRIAVVDQVFYYHRLEQEGNTRTKRNRHPLSFYDSWKEVVKTLKEKGRYDALEQGLMDALLRSSLSRMRHFIQRRDEDAFLAVYETVQGEILPILKLEERGVDYFTNQRSYETALVVQRETPMGYLIDLSEKEAEMRAKRRERIEKQQARIERQKERIAKQKVQIKKLKARKDELIHKRNKLIGLNKGIGGSGDKIVDLVQSRSFRLYYALTKPVRAVRRAFSRGAK